MAFDPLFCVCNVRSPKGPECRVDQGLPSMGLQCLYTVFEFRGPLQNIGAAPHRPILVTVSAAPSSQTKDFDVG